MMRTALLVGISGLAGRSLLETLLNNRNFKKITVFTRRDTKRLKNIHLKRVLVDFSVIENYKDEFEGINDVFCLLGTDYIITKDLEDASSFDYEYPLRFAKTAKGAGIKNFYLLSSTSAQINSSHPKHSLRAKLEQDIQELGFDNFYIFRVNHVGKSANDSSTFYVAKRGLSKVINLVGFGVLGRITQTPANLLARKMVEIALTDSAEQHLFNPKDY